MPYTKNKLPDNLPTDFTTEQIDSFISAANSALEEGKDEGSAIAIGISSGKEIKKGDYSKKGKNKDRNLIKNMLYAITSYLQDDDDSDDKDGHIVVKVDEEYKEENPRGKGNIVARSGTTQSIVKFNEEQMIAIEPLYAMPMESDLHGDGMTPEEIQSMVENINTNILKIKGNIGHVYDTEGFYFLKAWVNQCECLIGDELVLEGQPIIKVQFTDKKLWDMRKNGTLQGLSIGALGNKIDNPDYMEE